MQILLQTQQNFLCTCGCKGEKLPAYNCLPTKCRSRAVDLFQGSTKVKIVTVTTDGQKAFQLQDEDWKYFLCQIQMLLLLESFVRAVGYKWQDTRRKELLTLRNSPGSSNCSKERLPVVTAAASRLPNCHSFSPLFLDLVRRHKRTIPPQEWADPSKLANDQNVGISLTKTEGEALDFYGNLEGSGKLLCL